MRFLHLSDLHLGKTLFAYNLLEDQRHWCRELLTFLEDHPHDGVVLAGDLYDRTVPSAEAVDLCDWFFSQLIVNLKLPVLCIAGNHDSPSRLQFGSALYRTGGLYMAGRPNKEIIPVTLTDDEGPVNFYLVPYLSASDGRNLFPDASIKTCQDAFRVLLEENRERISWEERNVIVAHGFFASWGNADPGAGALLSDSESTVGGADLVDARLMSDFDYAALGHLHAPQTAGLPHLQYCGSPLKYSVSEEKQQKRVLSVTLGKKGDLVAEPVFFAPLRDVRTVTGTIEELLLPTGGGFFSDDYVLLNVLTDTTLLGTAEQLRNVYPHYLAIRYLSPIQREVELGMNAALANRSLEDAFSAFFLEVTGRDLLPEELSLVAKTAESTREGGRV